MTRGGIAVFSEVTAIRNIADVPFPARIRNTPAEEKVYNSVNSLLNRIGGFETVKISDMPAKRRFALAESGIITRECAEGKFGAVAFRKDGQLTVTVNGDDHIAERVMISGEDVFEAFKKLSELDKLILANLRIARRGETFFTARPIDSGAGVRASVYVFAPILSSTRRIIEIVKESAKIGVVVEETASESDLFLVKSAPILGDKAERAIESVAATVKKIIEAEKAFRREYYIANKTALKDECLRAVGVIKNCVRLSYAEMCELIGKIKLGIFFGFIKTDDEDALNELYFTAKTNMLSLLVPQSVTSDERRAILVKETAEKTNIRSER